jgi:hypothetical protein
MASSMPTVSPPADTLTIEEREALEDAEDVAAARASLEQMERTGEKGRPWREVFAELELGDPDELGPDDE